MSNFASSPDRRLNAATASLLIIVAFDVMEREARFDSMTAQARRELSVRRGPHLTAVRRAQYSASVFSSDHSHLFLASMIDLTFVGPQPQNRLGLL